MAGIASNTARERLDARLATLKPIERFQVPTKGWVRAIRDALGMSGAQLGKRLGVKAQSIADLEKSEIQGTIQLNTLRRAAAAMDCVVVYALVPRSTLVETVENRAREIARKELARISHTMDLEAQGLSKTDREAQVDVYMRDHLRIRDLWEDE
ncbi:MAG: mobile mystery protein A [Pseudomonadota bacterium]